MLGGFFFPLSFSHLCVTSAEESGDIEGGRHGIMRLLQRRKEDVGDAITIV